MSIASLILGIVSIILGFIPFCGAIALIPAIVGIILGIVDIVKRKKSKQPLALAIVGTVLSSVAIFIILFWLLIIGVYGLTDMDINNTISNNDIEYNNPIVGKWLGSSDDVGYFEFKENNTFYWYKSKDELDDNYYTGRYIISEGALQNNGNIDYGQTGNEIYTVNLYYDSQKVDGVKKTRSDKGMFIIQKNSNNQFTVRNMKTESIYKINRVY